MPTATLDLYVQAVDLEKEVAQAAAVVDAEALRRSEAALEQEVRPVPPLSDKAVF